MRYEDFRYEKQQLEAQEAWLDTQLAILDTLRTNVIAQRNDVRVHIEISKRNMASTSADSRLATYDERQKPFRNAVRGALGFISEGIVNDVVSTLQVCHNAHLGIPIDSVVFHSDADMGELMPNEELIAELRDTLTEPQFNALCDVIRETCEKDPDTGNYALPFDGKPSNAQLPF